MRRPVLIILGVIATLAGAEGLAWWWMNPPLAGAGQPVLAYRPTAGMDRRAGREAASRMECQGSGDKGQESEASGEKSVSFSKLFGGLDGLAVESTFTLLPEEVSRAMPSLRCSSGIAACIDRSDGISVFVAFFEWDRASSTNVLEAFKHLPEQCMGSIGMTLIKMHPPRSYTIGIDHRAGPDSANGAEGQAPAGSSQISEGKEQQTPSAEHHSKCKMQHPKFATQSLSFDHTEFRDPAGRPVHAFKSVWVSGADTLLGEGIRGGEEQWRQLRWRAALKRFRPAHARTAQGAIHGIANPDRAWKIFEESMLRDLTFER